MKTLVKNYVLNGNGKTLNINLKASFTMAGMTDTTTADVLAETINCMSVKLDRANMTGALEVKRASSGENYFSITDNVMTLKVTNLPAGNSIALICAKVGTLTRVLAKIYFFVKTGASGTDAASSFDLIVSDTITLAGETQQDLVFANIESMIDYLNDASADALKVSANLYVITTDTADFWISGIAETSSEYTYVSDAQFMQDIEDGEGKVQVGFYQVSELEPIVFGFHSVDWEITYEDDTTETLQIVVAK